MGNIIQSKMFGQQPSGSFADKLVFYWRGIEAGNAVDESFYGNHGTITGATWQGQGLYFDGVSDVVVLAKKPLEGASAFTVIVIATATNIDTDRGLFYTEAHSSNNPILMWMDTGTPDTLASLVTTSGGTTGSLLGSTTLQGGVRYHMAITYDGVNVRAYVDGNEQGGSYPAALAGTVNTSSLSYRFGNDNAALRDLLGTIEYVAIYTRALSVNEIQQLDINPGLPMQQAPTWARLPTGVNIPVMIHHYKQAGGL